MQFYKDPEVQQAHQKLYSQALLPSRPVLPPGKTEAQFAQILDSLRAIVGAENVSTGAALNNFVDPFTHTPTRIPSAALSPGNVTQVQEILRIANAHTIPLWTVSLGKNLGYGGPAPRVEGSVLISLHRMNKILEVNEKDTYVVVEPGVSFYELSHYCRKNAPKVWPSVTTIAWGSVVGNTLDRGFGYNIVGDHYHHISGLEVVLPNGDIIRTGQWAKNDCPSRFICKNSFGPQIDGLFLQSNLGIVTKMALWTQPRPETYLKLDINLEDFNDIEPLVDALAELRRDDILQNDPFIRNIGAHANIFVRKAEYQPNHAPLSEEHLDKLKQKFSMGYWAVSVDFYGPREMVQARHKRTEQVLYRYLPNASVKSQFFDESEVLDDAKLAAEARAEAVSLGSVAISSAIDYSLPLDGSGRGAHHDWVPILPHDGKITLKWMQDTKRIIESHGFDLMVGAHFFRKHLIITNMVFFNCANAVEANHVDQLRTELYDLSQSFGVTSYRAHPDEMDPVQDQFDFNNHAYRRFVETLKEKIDPNGILSPGKQGIWPSKTPKRPGHL